MLSLPTDWNNKSLDSKIDWLANALVNVAAAIANQTRDQNTGLDEIKRRVQALEQLNDPAVL